jgi:PelA/Pel-15E family pectate lyase
MSAVLFRAVWALVAVIGFADAARPAVPALYLNRPAEWYAGPEAEKVAANVLSYQSADGSWPKNINTTSAPYAGDPAKLQGTFDNGATTGELRFLARVYSATKKDGCRDSFLKGFDAIVKAQYPTGGWPQYYPPPKSYHRHITFNDDSMNRLMELLRDVSVGKFEFVDADRRKAAGAAFDRGIQCVLKCQVTTGGKRTAWCAQHDETDYSPRTGRAYELPSLSGSESVSLTRLLMSLDNPSPEVVSAVDGAVEWFKASRIEGTRLTVVPDAMSPSGRNRVVVKDPAAPSLWARFYEIETNRPIFVDRDGVKKYSLAEIGYERRNGYSWLGNWPEKLLREEYPAWKEKTSRPGGTAAGK